MRRLGSLVLLRAGEPGAVQTLLLVVEGEYAETDRLARIEGDAGEPIRRRRAHVFEVGGAATDDYAECDNGIRTVLQGHLAHHRQLEASGNAHDRECRAGLGQHPLSPGDQTVGDLLVPGAGDDDDRQARPVDLFQGVRRSGSAHRDVPSAEACRVSASWLSVIE